MKSCLILLILVAAANATCLGQLAVNLGTPSCQLDFSNSNGGSFWYNSQQVNFTALAQVTCCAPGSCSPPSFDLIVAASELSLRDSNDNLLSEITLVSTNDFCDSEMYFTTNTGLNLVHGQEVRISHIFGSYTFTIDLNNQATCGAPVQCCPSAAVCDLSGLTCANKGVIVEGGCPGCLCIIEKPGECPSEGPGSDPNNYVCQQKCSYDNECSGDQKCCFDGMGNCCADPAGSCPVVDCSAVLCPAGFQKDANGCPTCECAPCDIPDCDLACDSYKKDANGCALCECEQNNCNTPPCNLACDSYKKDANGCPLCECEQKACDMPACTLACDAFKTDANGCPLCECEQNTCGTPPCNLACDSYKKDANGCPLCECEQNACDKPVCNMACDVYKTDENGCELCECEEIISCDVPACDLACDSYKTDQNGCALCECEDGCPETRSCSKCTQEAGCGICQATRGFVCSASCDEAIKTCSRRNFEISFDGVILSFTIRTDSNLDTEDWVNLLAQLLGANFNQFIIIEIIEDTARATTTELTIFMSQAFADTVNQALVESDQNGSLDTLGVTNYQVDSANTASPASCLSPFNFW